jgi:hypothetical protein
LSWIARQYSALYLEEIVIAGGVVMLAVTIANQVKQI